MIASGVLSLRDDWKLSSVVLSKHPRSAETFSHRYKLFMPMCFFVIVSSFIKITIFHSDNNNNNNNNNNSNNNIIVSKKENKCTVVDIIFAIPGDKRVVHQKELKTNISGFEWEI